MVITEENFVEELRKKNEAALEYLMEVYGPLFKTIVRRNLADLPQEQEECLEDVFFRIWRHIGQFDQSRSSFRNWAAAICKFRTIDYRRRFQRSLKTVPLEKAESLISGEGGKSPQEISEWESRERMQELLRPLDERDREIFLRIYFENQSAEEVGREMAVRRSWLYNRLSRGKEKIRRYWKERGGYPHEEN